MWYNCLNCKAEIPDCTNYGWKLVQDSYEPIFSSLPSLPKQQIYITCNCKLGKSHNFFLLVVIDFFVKGCNTMKCKCARNKLTCIASCKCMSLCKEVNSESDSEED